jgi:NAD(P)-dependent dehydrogenase (short-subunit alcohol dehydrogenase family)
VDFDTLLLLMGSQGLRLAMNQFIKEEEPCVRAPPAGQSMLFAGFNAHKALDFKCIGLNVSFGPQPRGQRIQEMGRNWRNCMGSKYINLRQIFLVGDPTKVLGGDLLLDSFYEAQSEVVNWIRIITVSACLGRFTGPGTSGGLAPYRVSKAAVNALTKNFAAEMQYGRRGVLVDAMCPNHCRTDMGGPDAPRSAAEGADTIVWLATRPAQEADGSPVPTGLLWEDREIVPW